MDGNEQVIVFLFGDLILEQVVDVFIYLNWEGVIEWWNWVVILMFGYEFVEVYG